MTSKQVLSRYRIGKVTAITRITAGHIHASYKVDTESGSYLLQHLHPKLSSQAFTKDYCAVATYLARCGSGSQEMIADVNNVTHIPDGKRAWRLLTFIPGQVYLKLRSPTQAYVVGKTLGEFHTTLKKFRYKFTAPLRLHETKKVLRTLRHVTANTKYKGLLPEVSQETTLLKATLPSLLLPNGLPKRVVHGDPKISNFVFTGDRKAMLIDLDTCMRATPLVDIGDALRSWSNTGTEEKPKFERTYFRQALRGYRDSTPGLLSSREIRLIVRATLTITLELATRFLIDYFENSYFGWDHKKFSSRRAHNLIRARGMIHLYRAIHASRNALEHSVNTIFKAH